MKRYPLKFLDSYTKADTDIFFGRKAEIDTLYEMVFQSDILLLYGASGTGKTSLIQCGLASRFESHDWLDIFIRRGNNINESLQNALVNVGGTLEEADFDLLDFDLENLDNEVIVENELSNLERQFKNIYLNAFRPIYLIFDQFEELYILGTEAEQTEFIANIKTILNLSQPVKMIFSIREEYLGYLYDFEREIPQLLKKKLRVEPMNITKVQEVIEGVTTYKDSNISIQKKEIIPFTEQVFERLQGRDEDGKQRKSLTIELPYLQVFLDKIYLEITNDESRNANAQFSLKALKNIGEIDDVLRQFLEEQVVLVSQQLRPKFPNIMPEYIWQILSPFVTLDGTKEPIAAEVIIEKIDNTLKTDSKVLMQDLTEAFIKGKIIRYSDNNDVYEIAHDSLAKKIAEKRSDEEIALLEVKRLIKSQTNLKEEARENFTEKQLIFITEYLDKLTLEQEELDFINESQQKVENTKVNEKREQEKRLKAAEAQAKNDRKLRNRATRFSRFAIGIALFAGLIAIAAIYFFIQSKEAENRAERQLIKSLNTDIELIKKDIDKANENIKSFKRYKSEKDVINFEKSKIENWKQEIDNLNAEIKKIEE
ncbi:MAG: hypothetical protein AB8G11_12150 [Saprospiraceae bacterium]